MENFRKLKLSNEILKSIEEAGFENPSEIQEKAIPYLLEGKDLVGKSATGSGKTLAFSAGIISKCEKGKGVQALILTPTRELAEQVADSIRNFSRYHKLYVKEIYGGVSYEPQTDALRKADIVVGTPGRILDHINRRTIDLRNVKFLVLDEADRMLDMGFIRDVDAIIEECPEERQTMLFSATISRDIEQMSKEYMKDPVYVEATHYVDPSKLKQVYYDVQQNVKFSLLLHLLKQERSGLVMVFCNTRRNADLVANNLKRYGLHSLAIHGGLAQSRRTNIIKEFHSSETLILVCTDVAARGLDIKGVSHVYNYDLPNIPADYVHRIGRTARAGKEGIAISLVSPRDYDNFKRILDDESIKVESLEAPEVERIDVNFSAGRGFGRDRGRSGGFGRGRRDSRGSRGDSRGRGDRDERREGGRDRGDRRERSRGRGDSRRDSRRGSRNFSRGRSGGYSRGSRRR